MAGVAASSIKRGDVVGRFVVLDELGRGGMGVVLSAYDPKLDRRVALKVLHTVTASSAEARERLLREAKAMAKLRHPNAVTVYDVGTHHDQIYFAMEFAGGGTLGSWSAGRTQGEILAAYIAAGRGLAAAHRAGLIHRDFKPQNVLIGDEDRVQVTDFGLVGASATPTDSGSAGARGVALTEIGSVIGTPAYMSPEQHRGETLDATTDQFSFCVALWEALCGERPFPGKNIEEVQAAMSSERAPVPPAGAAMPRWIRNILVKGLARDKQDRFDSMDELLAELDRDDTDIELGRTTRIVTMIVLGTVWTATPLALALANVGQPTTEMQFIAMAALSLFTVVIAYAARESLRTSYFNRQMTGIILLMFGTQLVLLLGIMLADLPDRFWGIVSLFSWFIFSAVSMLLIERRMFLSTVGFLIGFFVVCKDEHLLWWMLAGGNAMLTINMVWIWRPPAGLFGLFPRRHSQNRGFISPLSKSRSSDTHSFRPVSSDEVLASDDTVPRDS